MRTLYLLLADLLLVVHALIVVFNVGALPVIWVGYFRNWNFVRNFGFRLTHLLLIGFVAVESFFGVVCPLTTWENFWLTKAGVEARYQRGYLGYWIDRLIFYNFNEAVFTVAYVVFFILVLLTFFWVKPRMPHWSARNR